MQAACESDGPGEEAATNVIYIPDVCAWAKQSCLPSVSPSSPAAVAPRAASVYPSDKGNGVRLSLTLG